MTLLAPRVETHAFDRTVLESGQVIRILGITLGCPLRAFEPRCKPHQINHFHARSSNPVASIVSRNEPFDESVEGLFRFADQSCGDESAAQYMHGPSTVSFGWQRNPVVPQRLPAIEETLDRQAASTARRR